MAAFQSEMRTVFKQLCVTQDIHGAQLGKIVESPHRYLDELLHLRASIDRQEVMLARLYEKFMPDEGNSGGGGANFSSL